MNEAQMQARRQAIDYMVRLLQMNPIQEGDEIISARSKALGLAKRGESAAAAAAAEAPQVDRRKVLEALEAVRSQFWTMPIDELNRQLAALDSQGFSDLEAAIGRLRVVAAHRALFPALAGKPGFDGEFFSALKEVLIRSPRDTAVLREKVLSSFRNRARRKGGRKMVALLKAEVPAIYELEADWFDTLYRQKAHLVGSSRGSGLSVSATGFAKFWWVILFGMAAVRGCVTMSDADSRNSKSRSTPSYQIQSPRRNLPADQLGFGRDYFEARSKDIEEESNARLEEMYKQLKKRSIEVEDPNSPWARRPSRYEPPLPDRSRGNIPAAPNVNPSPSSPQPNGRFQ